METDAILEQARAAYARHDWIRARDDFRQARTVAPLSAADLYLLADANWWLGSFRQAKALYEESYELYLQEQQPRSAAMMAFGIAGMLMMRGEVAAGSGWFGRALRLLENEPPGMEHGYILFVNATGALQSGDLAGALDLARQLQATGSAFNEQNLLALGILAEGQALIRQSALEQGIRLLDEAMLSAASGRLAPEWAGYIYCQLMAACHELGDLQRAREWTQATARWCESLPGAGPFFGVCRVHRAQIYLVQGNWDRAEAEANRVCQDLADFDLGTVSEGYYQLGELKRLRGDLAGAEAAFRQAHVFGRDPQPGLALLLLAQGRADRALISIQNAFAVGRRERLYRAWLCVAQVDIALAAGRGDLAQLACDELHETTSTFRTSILEAMTDQARGELLLHNGALEPALQPLRAACLRWQQLSAPYDAARVRVSLAKTYAGLGDNSAADLELEAALHVFRSLGALPDVRRVEALRSAPPPSYGLSSREIEVLSLISAGRTNRSIADALVISEKTVARHLTNIYTKLGISSRTEAARFAFEHGLAAGNG